MSKTDDLVEQQIKMHEAHLKRIDELFERARQADEGGPEEDPLLAALESERNQLEALLHRMRGDTPESWQEAAEQQFGPLAIWETIARLIQRSIERLEKRA